MGKVRLTNKEWASFLQTTGLDVFAHLIPADLASKIKVKANDWYNQQKEFESVLTYGSKAGKVLSIKDGTQKHHVLGFKHRIFIKIVMDFDWYYSQHYQKGSYAYIDIKICDSGNVGEYVRVDLNSRIIEISDFDVMKPEPTLLMEVSAMSVTSIQKLKLTDKRTMDQIAALLLTKGNEQQANEAIVYLTKGEDGLKTLDIMRANLEATKLELDKARQTYLALEDKYHKLVEEQLKSTT